MSDKYYEINEHLRDDLATLASGPYRKSVHEVMADESLFEKMQILYENLFCSKSGEVLLFEKAMEFVCHTVHDLTGITLVDNKNITLFHQDLEFDVDNKIKLDNYLQPIVTNSIETRSFPANHFLKERLVFLLITETEELNILLNKIMVNSLTEEDAIDILGKLGGTQLTEILACYSDEHTENQGLIKLLESLLKK